MWANHFLTLIESVAKIDNNMQTVESAMGNS